MILLSFSHSLSLSPSLSLCVSHSLTHTHTFSVALLLFLSLSIFLPFPLSLSLSPARQYCNTHRHVHLHTHTHTHTHASFIALERGVEPCAQSWAASQWETRAERRGGTVAELGRIAHQKLHKVKRQIKSASPRGFSPSEAGTEEGREVVEKEQSFQMI